MNENKQAQLLLNTPGSVFVVDQKYFNASNGLDSWVSQQPVNFVVVDACDCDKEEIEKCQKVSTVL